MWILLYVPAVAGVVALHPDAVFDPVGAAVKSTYVVVEDGKIRDLVPKAPVGAEVVELVGVTLVPGYVDAHTHLLTSMGEAQHGSFTEAAAEPLDYRALRGAKKANDLLRAGFTTVRDLGNSGNYGDLSLRRAVREGLVEGPRVLASGPIISPFGGQYTDMNPAFPRHELPEYQYADSSDELRKAVREHVFYGVDLIKVVVDGSHGYAYTAADLGVAVDEAHRAGVRVAAHATTDASVEVAIDAGVDTIEHAFSADADTLERAAEAGIPIVATPFTVETLLPFGWSEEKARSIAVKHVNQIKQMHDVGVTLVFGSDLLTEVEGRTAGTLALGQITSFAQAGLSGREVLQTLTTNPCAALALTDCGRVLPGARADLVGVTGDPEKRAEDLKNVVFVMRTGQVVRPLDR